VGETAKAVMPDEITEPRFLQDWKQEILEVAEARCKHRWLVGACGGLDRG
jgi:hypothetical protein